MKQISIKEDQFWKIKENMNGHKLVKYHDYIELLLGLDELSKFKGICNKDDKTITLNELKKSTVGNKLPKEYENQVKEAKSTSNEQEDKGLKILKDIEFIDCEDYVPSSSPYEVGYHKLNEDKIRYNLKQEAIKWIKELDNDNLTVSNDIPSTAEGHEQYHIESTNKSALILWIKYFFNLTKEELK